MTRDAWNVLCALVECGPMTNYQALGPTLLGELRDLGIALPRYRPYAGGEPVALTVTCLGREEYASLS